ncbi:MAG: hypothetical protein HYS62_00425, partial [Candidatus Aenigmarchaeota archaeon]|nr:hypothetical protein [Candidatus Aenigmarchaeota archaeon]
MSLLKSINIKKIGKNRLIIYLPKSFRKNNKFNNKETVKMSLKKHDKELIVISKFNYLITLKKEAVSNLNLKHGDSIDVFISKLNVAEKPTYFINNGKISHNLAKGKIFTAMFETGMSAEEIMEEK